MKIALFSDIHGNHVALEAVLADIERQQPDHLICLGDVATLGPQPKEVFATLQKLDAVFIQGNHDAAMLAPEHAEKYNIEAMLHGDLQWTINQSTTNDLEFVRSFLLNYTIQLGNEHEMLCFHGSPHCNTGLILATTPMDELDRLLGKDQPTIMVGGHSHVQMLRQHHGNLVINAGSVGSSFTEPPYGKGRPQLNPWAEYALVEYENGRITVNLQRIPFDTQKFHQITRASKLPIKEWWLSQYS